MPPKKQQQQNIAPYIPIYVLPLIANSYQALQTLRKSVSIKKDIDKAKIIQILKEKGLDKFIKENQISKEGDIFICQNMTTVYEQYMNQIKKPADPKKEVKKDSKKDSKKEQAPEQEKQKPIQLNFQKQCSDFYFLYDYPATIQQLQACLKSNTKIDIVLLIQEKIKKGSKLPNYELLNQNRQNQQLKQQLQSTSIKSKKSQKLSQIQILKNNKIVDFFKKKQSEYAHIQSSIVIQVNYLLDLSHPQNDQTNFLNEVFKKLCQLTVDKQTYKNWKDNIKLIPMVQPITQVVTKQVQIEQKKQDKKGGKKQNKQPEFQTVQQTIYTPYQSIPQHQKSDLKQYKRVCSLKQKSRKNIPGKDQISFVLNNCIQTTFKLESNEKSQKYIHQKLVILENTPIGKISIENLKGSVRDICYYRPQNLSFEIQTPSAPLQNKLKLSQILQIAPEKQQTLRMEYMIQQFEQFMSQKQSKLKWNFSDRLYVEKFSKDRILSQINQQLLNDPQLYKGELINDKIKLFVLARVNPPGRIIYNNSIFDWKVAPNFQKWQNLFKNNKNLAQIQQFYNYKFQDAGNLSIKSQRMMPNDNTVITDATYTIGNKNMRINNFNKENKYFGIRKLNQTNQFWLNYKKQISLEVFQKDHLFVKKAITQQINSEGIKQIKQIQTQEKLKRVQTWIRNQKYIIGNDPYPKIYWKNHLLQVCRQFGPKGQITCHLKDGSKKIYYPNGNVSSYRNCKWTKYINNNSVKDGIQREVQFQVYFQGSKQIKIREDNTIFVHYQNGDSQVIFQDSTQIYHNLSSKSIEILTKNQQQQIVIRLIQPRDKDFNIIGFGSAFAYLGFQNLIERTYNGFIYQLWTPNVSSHLYLQKYELNNKFFEEEIRLINFEDGTIVKISGNGTLSYIAGNYDKSREKLNQNWHQLFTNPQNHKQGVYDADLNIGSIWTKDSQSNYFKINVQQECQINVSVSFKIGDDEKLQNNFGNGFHVPQQNYFLPPPTNGVTPRLFSFDEEGNYCEYLSKQQLKCMREEQYYIDEQKSGEVLIKQYTKPQILKKTIEDLTFSKSVNLQKFQIPLLIASKNSRTNMPIENSSRIIHRIISEIPWSSTYENIKYFENQLNESKKKRQCQSAVFAK